MRATTGFLDALVAKYPRLKNATVRKPTADEIRYFWATIAFDIEAPLFAIEGSEVFIANFAGGPALFWIDLVGDLQDD